MSSPYFRKGFKLALTETFFKLGNLLTEGIDIRAFEKLSDDEGFQKACEIFKSRLQGDNDARNKFNLKDLNIYKENIEGFVKAVGDALEYIEKRSKDKNARKARKIEGVDVLYEDDNCFIVSPQSPEYSHKAAYLDGGTANWCIASNDVSRAKNFWKQYDAEMVVYVYYKGEPNDSWAMVFTRKNLKDIVEGNVSVENRCYTQFETRMNAGHSNNVFAQKSEFYEMLFKIEKSPKDFFSILRSGILKFRSELAFEDMVMEVIGDPLSENSLKVFKGMLKSGYDVFGNDSLMSCLLKKQPFFEEHYAKIAESCGIDVRSQLLNHDYSVYLQGWWVAEVLSTEHWRDYATLPQLSWFFEPSEDDGYVKHLDYDGMLTNSELLVWMHQKRGVDFNAKFFGHCSRDTILNKIIEDDWSTKNLEDEEWDAIIDGLIAAGADINAISGSGYNALYASLMYQHLGIAEKLLERGAVYSDFDESNLKIMCYEEPLMSSTGETPIFNLLWKDSSDTYESIMSNTLDFCINRLGININQKDSRGWTALDNMLDKAETFCGEVDNYVEILEAYFGKGAKMTAFSRKLLTHILKEEDDDENTLKEKFNAVLRRYNVRPLK